MSFLARLRDPRPVLQIIHVSDMHVLATNNHPAAAAVRRAARWLRRTPGCAGFAEELLDKTAPSCTFSPLVFPDFVKRITVSHPVWSAYRQASRKLSHVAIIMRPLSWLPQGRRSAG